MAKSINFSCGEEIVENCLQIFVLEIKVVILYTEKPALLLTAIAVCVCQVTKPHSASFTKCSVGFKVFVVCVEQKFVF